MTRIKTVSPDNARGIRRLAVLQARRRYGYVPGIFRIALVDFPVGRHLGAVYERLHLRTSSPLSRLQREMIALVVNGHVNGAP